jgi:hypothetical protein
VVPPHSNDTATLRGFSKCQILRSPIAGAKLSELLLNNGRLPFNLQRFPTSISLASRLLYRTLNWPFPIHLHISLHLTSSSNCAPVYHLASNCLHHTKFPPSSIATATRGSRSPAVSIKTTRFLLFIVAQETSELSWSRVRSNSLYGRNHITQST